MACRTGHATKLLQKVSRALGGVTVHGYANYITTTNYWLWASIDEGVGDEYTINSGTSFEEVPVGKHIVCWPTMCPPFAWISVTDRLCCADFDYLSNKFHLAVRRLRQRPDLIRSFFAGAGLDL
jgi:hypothetical protein